MVTCISLTMYMLAQVKSKSRGSQSVGRFDYLVCSCTVTRVRKTWMLAEDICGRPPKTLRIQQILVYKSRARNQTGHPSMTSNFGYGQAVWRAMCTAPSQNVHSRNSMYLLSQKQAKGPGTSLVLGTCIRAKSQMSRD